MITVKLMNSLSSHIGVGGDFMGLDAWMQAQQKAHHNGKIYLVLCILNCICLLLIKRPNMTDLAKGSKEIIVPVSELWMNILKMLKEALEE